MKTKSFFIGLSVLGFTSVLNAGQNQNMESFNNFDLNKDGIVTQKEFDDTKTAKMTARANEGRQLKNAGNSLTFQDIDTNKDGKITQNELSIAQQKHMQQNRMKHKKAKGMGKKQGQRGMNN